MENAQPEEAKYSLVTASTVGLNELSFSGYSSTGLSYPSGIIQPIEDVGKVEIQVQIPEIMIGSQAFPANEGMRTPPHNTTHPPIMAGSSINLKLQSPGPISPGAVGIRLNRYDMDGSDSVIGEDDSGSGRINRSENREESKQSFSNIFKSTLGEVPLSNITTASIWNEVIQRVEKKAGLKSSIEIAVLGNINVGKTSL